MSDALCVAHPLAVPWGVFKIKAACQRHPVCLLDEVQIANQELCTSQEAQILWSILSICYKQCRLGPSGWTSSSGMSIIPVARLQPNVFKLLPSCTPPLASHTCKSPPLAHYLPKTSWRITPHSFPSGANKKAGEKWRWNVLLCLSRASPLAASRVAYEAEALTEIWGGDGRGTFLFLCWANTVPGWRSLESSKFLFLFLIAIM